MFPVSARILILLCLLSLTKCMVVDSGGSGTETTTGIIGAVFNDKGDPEANVRVQLIPEGFDPVVNNSTVTVDTTDSLGNYAFTDINLGRYSIQVIHLEKLTRSLNSKIEVIPDTIVSVTSTLHQTGQIKVWLPDKINDTSGYVYVPGTTFFVFCNKRNDFAVLDSMPAGLIPEIVYSSLNSSGKTTLRFDVPVASNDTVVVYNPTWKYAHELILNTSRTGADISETITGFPVLIRLDSSNFDFSEVLENGSDILFTKTDNSVLPCEIEYWNAADRNAAIWVNADTVYGNNADQKIIMYWGNTMAHPLQHPPVFDTSAGYQGVWHFSDGTGDEIRDATQNGYYGIITGSASPQITEGISGNYRSFDGLADFIHMPQTANSKLNFPEDGYYTISAWVRLDILDSQPRLILSKGYEQYFLRLTYFPLNAPQWEFSQMSQAGIWQACTSTAAAGEWTLLTCVRQGKKQTLYCNGMPIDSTPNSYQKEGLVRNTTGDFLIGKFSNAVALPNNSLSYCFFKGAIDEVRVTDNARSPDWIRLCYMNQRIDDRLIRFNY
ncbi:MAG: DUF2341 domain-containing protein [Chitinispirillaceae bacterium]|nr:DUF2341 domain-containing protein [Chitinispirillaceae bacterium]